MKIIYDTRTDTMQIVLTDTPVNESDEDKPGVVVDYDGSGNVVGMEILGASKRMEIPETIEYVIG